MGCQEGGSLWVYRHGNRPGRTIVMSVVLHVWLHWRSGSLLISNKTKLVCKHVFWSLWSKTSGSSKLHFLSTQEREDASLFKPKTDKRIQITTCWDVWICEDVFCVGFFVAETLMLTSKVLKDRFDTTAFQVSIYRDVVHPEERWGWLIHGCHDIIGWFKSTWAHGSYFVLQEESINGF